MGEFSIGHAGFMAVGAYPRRSSPCACSPRWRRSRGSARWRCWRAGWPRRSLGLVIAIPSFRTRGDYLAIVTLAFTMIVKSGLENLDVGRRPARASPGCAS